MPVTMLWQIESPRPVPTPTALVVKKGSKMRATTLAGIPAPVSRTVTTAQPRSSVEVAMRISFSSVLPSGMACAALTRRLMKTCPSRASSAVIRGVLP